MAANGTGFLWGVMQMFQNEIVVMVACVCVCVSVTQSCLTLCDPMDCSRQAPLSMEFSRQEYWSGLSFPFPEDLPNLRLKPWAPALHAGSLTSELLGNSILQLKVTLESPLDCKEI